MVYKKSIWYTKSKFNLWYIVFSTGIEYIIEEQAAAEQHLAGKSVQELVKVLQTGRLNPRGQSDTHRRRLYEQSIGQ
jgi:hypothetical protein